VLAGVTAVGVTSAGVTATGVTPAGAMASVRHCDDMVAMHE
jgi:hypothetical protein